MRMMIGLLLLHALIQGCGIKGKPIAPDSKHERGGETYSS